MNNTCAKISDAVQSRICNPAFCINALHPRNTELALVSSVAVCALTPAQNIRRIATAIPVRMKISSCDAMAYIIP
jgi:hypothetical protein